MAACTKMLLLDNLIRIEDKPLKCKQAKCNVLSVFRLLSMNIQKILYGLLVLGWQLLPY